MFLRIPNRSNLGLILNSSVLCGRIAPPSFKLWLDDGVFKKNRLTFFFFVYYIIYRVVG